MFVEGATLRETLLLNLIAADTTGLEFPADDAPAWRRPVSGPGTDGPHRLPTGIRDLYTWQTRRLRLHHDHDHVTGVIVTVGDPLAGGSEHYPFTPHNKHLLEPMTAWRHKPADEKKLNLSKVWVPRLHDPSRSAWRGLAALIANQTGAVQTTTGADTQCPAVVNWVARLATNAVLPRGFQIVTRTVGMVYGTQQSAFSAVVDDRVAMSVILLHRQDRRFAIQATAAVHDSDTAVRHLADLARNLGQAIGISAQSKDGKKKLQARAEAARDLGYAALDGPYRVWLAGLRDTVDPYEHRHRWRRTVAETVGRLGSQLLVEAGDAAWRGRMITITRANTDQDVWLNSALAENWFRRGLRASLGQNERSPSDRSGPEVPAA